MDFPALRRRQLDHQLAPLHAASLPIRPDQGWVRTLREALGMSLRQLAERAGVSKASVAQMESREARGAITLASLEKLAHAMESDLFYVILPRRGVDETVRHRAESLARRLAGEVAQSMELEGQATSEDRVRELVEHHATRLLADPGVLWDEV